VQVEVMRYETTIENKMLEIVKHKWVIFRW